VVGVQAPSKVTLTTEGNVTVRSLDAMHVTSKKQEEVVLKINLVFLFLTMVEEV
jgi:hypothetical protein